MTRQVAPAFTWRVCGFAGHHDKLRVKREGRSTIPNEAAEMLCLPADVQKLIGSLMPVAGRFGRGVDRGQVEAWTRLVCRPTKGRTPGGAPRSRRARPRSRSGPGRRPAARTAPWPFGSRRPAGRGRGPGRPGTGLLGRLGGEGQVPFVLAEFQRDVQSRDCAAVVIGQSPCFQPAVCFIDLNMPGMGGEELAIRLREWAAGRPLVLVAVTAMSGDEYRKQTAAGGFDLHFVKPVDPFDLVHVVNSLFQTWSAEKASGSR